MEAAGGDIGPVDGAFLCTSTDSSGVLIGAVAFSLERTILAGEMVVLQLAAKMKGIG
jgi:hypothetical protein